LKAKDKAVPWNPEELDRSAVVNDQVARSAESRMREQAAARLSELGPVGDIATPVAAPIETSVAAARPIVEQSSEPDSRAHLIQSTASSSNGDIFESPTAVASGSEPAPDPPLWAQKECFERAPGAPSADFALRLIRSQLEDIVEQAASALFEKHRLGLIGWGEEKHHFHHMPSTSSTQNWYFVGDLHGDFFAWHELWSHISKQPEFRLCFLGDLVDRGPHSVECFAAFLRAAMDYPKQILWIRGNHDGIGRLDEIASEHSARGDEIAGFASDQMFQASVSPSEFVDELNNPTSRIPRETRSKIGTLFKAVCDRLPRAALFPGGLLATHGGFPLRDHWATLTSIEAFENPRILDDFTWTRLSSARHKKGYLFDPDRRSRSSDFEFGYRDLEEFCQTIHSQISEIAITKLVRGHDHVYDGVDKPIQYTSVPVITLNGFGFNYLSNSFEEYRQHLVYARYRGAAEPEVMSLPYKQAEYDAILAEVNGVDSMKVSQPDGNDEDPFG
jgi:hypothetical protein